MPLPKIKQAALTVAFLSAVALPVLAQNGGGDAPPPPQGLFGGNFLFIMVAMFAIIYFVMIRPEQKKQKDRQKLLSALKKGDKVLTIGGIVGVVTVVKDSSYIVKSGDGAAFEITKSAISNLINDAKESREVPDAIAPSVDVKESKYGA